MSKKRNVGKVLNFWSWNGDMNLFEIREQLNDFAAGHFDGVIVHARAGLEIKYLSNEWFSAFSMVVSEAEKLGLDVYIYDEDGWPSGFAGGLVTSLGEEHWIKGLRYSYNRADADTKRAVAAFIRQPDGRMKLAKQEETEFADLVFWYETDSHYVDLMSHKTVRKFIDFTHEEYKKRYSKYFGKVIKGIFTDEPQLDIIMPWSLCLTEKFEKKCGYCLLENLWLLVEKGDGYLKFRNDFFTTIEDTFYNSFTKQIGDWCSENKLLFTGHFPCEDGLCGQISPVGSVMRHYSAMQFPGIDHLGNMQHSPVLLKQVSSVSQQLKNGDTLCEIFGCSGWDVPLRNLAWIWGRHSALGITSACCHLSAYTIKGIRKRDYPAFFSYQNSWWQDFTSLKKWMGNLSELMSLGERLTEAVLLSPFHSIKGEYNGTMHSFKLRSRSAQFRQLLQNLIDLQIDAEIADEHLLEQFGSVADGKLIIGKRKYKYLIVPECDSIKKSTLKIIKELSEYGARVIFINTRPSAVDFEESDEIFKVNAVECCNRIELLEKCLKHYKIEPFATVLKEDMSLMRNLTVHTADCGNKKRIHICCGDNFATANVLVTVEGKCSLEMVDILTKKRMPLKTEFSGSKSYVRLTLHSMENIVLQTSQASERSKTLELCKTDRIIPESLVMTDLNCLTIDKAYYSIDGQRSELMPVIKMAKELYDLAKPCLTVTVCYSFNVSSQLDTAGIKIAVEDTDCESVAVNGVDVTARKGNWWLDKCIHEYEVSEYLNEGENTVSVKYFIENYMADINVKEVFETERNRFFYPKEPECIYVRGNFDVLANGDIEKHPNYIRVKEPNFCLVKPTSKNMGELTSQGLWFYRGGMDFEFEYKKPEGNKRVVLRIEEPDCSVFRWSIGKDSGTIFAAPLSQDITDSLNEGVNRIRLHAVGNNRNLLGPHHHIKGKTNFVGVNTFKGEYGFEDFANVELSCESTWDDAYNFVGFSFGKIFIDEYTVSEEEQYG